MKEEEEIEGLAEMGFQWFEWVFGAVDGFDSSVVCGGSSLGGLLVVCLKQDVGVLLYANTIELESSEAANIVSDEVAEEELKGA